MHPPRILGLVVAPLLVLTACTPAPTTTPSPTPTTPMCTPEFGGDAYPCSTAEYDQMKLRDAEYARAEAVMRRLMELEISAAKEGRTEPTDEALSLTDGPAHEGLPALYQMGAGKERNLEITKVARWETSLEHEPVTLSLLACVKRRGGEHDTSTLEGGSAPMVVLFTQELKIWLLTREEGASCAG